MFYIAKSSEETPYIDQYHTQLIKQKVMVNETVNLKIGIYNPVNKTLSVMVRIDIFDDYVNCFPSNESVVLLPPKKYSASFKETEFILKPLKDGSYPISIQLWWNNTCVDHEILTLEVQKPNPPLAVDIWWGWVRFNLVIWGLIYIAVFVRFLDPSLKIILEGENGKWITFAIVSMFYFIFVFIFISGMSNNAIMWIVSSLSEATGILGVAWGFGAISLGASLFKKFKWGNTFSNFVFIFLMLSLIWDWLLFPQAPYPQWSPVLIIILTAFLNVLIETGIKGIFNRLKSIKKS